MRAVIVGSIIIFAIITVTVVGWLISRHAGVRERQLRQARTVRNAYMSAVDTIEGDIRRSYHDLDLVGTALVDRIQLQIQQAKDVWKEIE